jgi:hypothetical protein
MLKLILALLSGALLWSSCASNKITQQLPIKSGNYLVKTPQAKPWKAYVQIQDDSIAVYRATADGSFESPLALVDNSVLIDRGLDVDVLTVPFKYRPSAADFPRQLTTDFNGNIFLGLRSDRYREHLIKTPAGMQKDIKHKAFTAGVFGGIGTTFVSPWTTDNRTTDEYQGFILSHGLSAMVGIDNLTVGLGVGWDFLTDRDKNIWIYQNKPWLGMTLSLNIN